MIAPSAPRRPARTAAAVLGALLLAACGGGEEEVSQTAEVPPVSAACNEAFAAGSERATEAAADNEEKPVGAGFGAGGGDSSLLPLEGTVDACTSTDDWRGGARANGNRIPEDMNMDTALRFLCQSREDAPACQGLSNIPPPAGAAGES